MLSPCETLCYVGCLQSAIACTDDVDLFRWILSDLEQRDVDLYIHNEYGLPLCGDAICNSVESRLTCPSDCGI